MRENGVVQQEADWTRRTLDPPDGGLHPLCKVLLEGLPDKIKFVALAARYPRIANRIAYDWAHPDVLKPYLRNLLTTDRPGRVGFPPEVLRELFTFSNYYDSQIFPDPKSVWDAGG